MRFTTIFFRTVILGLTLSTVFLACDKPDPKSPTFTVTFDTQNGSKIDPQNVKSGQKATRPTDPTLQGYGFLGWYRDKAGTQVFDFAKETITASITLYANWLSRDIPDAKFRDKLKTIVPNAFTGDVFDPDHKDVIELTELDVSISTISSLSGIGHFTALKTLNCRNNPLNTLDVSKNILLESLNCSLNGLEKLDVSKNTKLTTLDCSINPLGSFDVSSNLALTQLTCYSNSLQSLDVSANLLLTTLDCSNNQLKLLDLRGMRSVTELIIKVTLDGSNRIERLKVHDAIKDHAKIKKAMNTRVITLETYSAPAGSTSYTLVCKNYNPFLVGCR